MLGLDVAMLSRSRVAPFLLLLLAATGCSSSAEDETGGKDDDFAVSQISPALSILPAIENSGGRPEICVGLIGFDDAGRARAADNVSRLVTDTLRKWTALLRGNPLWSLNAEITPTFAVQSTECAKNLPGFAVNVWATADGFKADYCSRPNYTCSSGAIAAYRTLYLGPWNRYQAEDAFAPFTTLHEVGHLLGLGDTYRISGANDWNGEQPPAVMNGRSSTLTNDDKLGLWVALRALKTGVRSCEGFGAEVAMTANAWNALMCDPSAAPVDNHGGQQPPVVATLPKEGTWAYVGYDPQRTAMRVRGVRPSGRGFTMLVAAVTNGQPSATDSTYICDAGGSCVAQTNATYRMLVASATSMRMINQSAPAGLQVDFAHP